MPAEKMHADEVDTDAALVRRLLAAQFPEWADLPIERVRSAGTDNTIYRLGQDMAVRLPRQQWNGAQLEKECRWLPRLAPLLPLAIPVPLAVGEPADDYPFAWSIYPWLEGETATVERIGDPSQLATDLTRFVAALQRVDPTDGPPPGQHNSFRGVPLATRDERTRSAIAALGGAIDSGAVTAAWETALRAPEWERPPVWIHGDLDARNMLVEEGRLTAVIDFGCLGVGDPACDVMVAWKVLSAETRDSFRTALSVDEATWARGRGWAPLPGADRAALLHDENEPRARPGSSTMVGRGTRGSRIGAPLTATRKRCYEGVGRPSMACSARLISSSSRATSSSLPAK